MIQKLTRQTVTLFQLTKEDKEILLRQNWVSACSMGAGDRVDAEIMFARTDAAHDTGVPSTVSEIIRR